MDFVRLLLQLITHEYLERPKGSRWKLTEYIAEFRLTLQHNFAQLTEAHKSNYMTWLMQESVRKQAIVRDQPKAVQRKMSTAFETMDKEVCILHR